MKGVGFRVTRFVVLGQSAQASVKSSFELVISEFQSSSGHRNDGSSSSSSSSNGARLGGS